MFKKKFLLLALPFATILSLHANDPMNDPFFNDPFGDDIFKEMMQMQKNMDKMFERMQHRMNQRSSGQLSPLGTYKIAVPNQLVDKGNHYELLTNIPQSKENHIDINTANGMMNITAKIVQEKEQKNQYGVSQSRSVRMYQQSTSLPLDADDSAISTSYKNGKLVVNIGKKQGSVKAIATPAAKPAVQPKAAKPAEKVVVPKPDYGKKSETKKEENTSVKSVPGKKTIHSDTPSMS